MPDAEHGPLFFSQVREDPRLEIEALQPGPGRRLVVVSSGGCTALSLLAAGAEAVTAVDRNPTQNHLVELKAAAAAVLDPDEVVAFLGAAPAGRALRRAWHQRLQDALSPDARSFWEHRRRWIEDGVLGAGRSERFIALVVAAIRRGVHPPSRLRRLLACRSLEEQRAFYEAEWDTWRWRALVGVLLSRWALGRAFEPEFFSRAERPSFARHFHQRVAHGLTQIPVEDNYFLHQMLTGRYPESDSARPPYLTGPGLATVADRRHALRLVDGGLTEYLRTCPAQSVDGFALSNVAEWLDGVRRDALFEQVVRTARPGAVVCFRNFVGWTEVPERWRARVREDRARGQSLFQHDRSLVQRRFAVCHVRDAPRPAVAQSRREVTVREARASDDAALRALAAACPMEGTVGLCVRREPSFFALNRLEGARWRVGVAEDAQGRIVGCVAAAEREVYLHGEPARAAYVSDLKVHPRHRDGRAADALTGWACQASAELAGHEAPILVTVLAGNRAMERRTRGPRGLPLLARFATLRVSSVPLLGLAPRPGRGDAARGGFQVTAARPDDVEAMTALWGRVARGRQFAPRLGRSALLDWTAAAPGLALSDYRLAWHPSGELAGFVAFWDQQALKQLHVTRYPPALALFRGAFNLVAPIVSAAPLPAAGGPIRHLALVHLCVPGHQPEMLRALLRAGRAEWRGRGYSFFTLGLDAADPLGTAVLGLLAATTVVHAYVTAPGGSYAGPSLADRPLHFETALV